MSNVEKLFVVIDPTEENHVALDRAIITSKLRDHPVKLYIFLTVDGDAVDTRSDNDALIRTQNWWDTEILKPLQDSGLDFELDISWCTEWQKSILKASRYFNTDIIYLPVHQKTKRLRFSFSESKWDLLKSSECPVLLARPGAKEKRDVILAAVNFQAETEYQRDLNKRILSQGKEIAKRYKAEFHVANAYLDSSIYPDRGKLAIQTGLPAECVHVRQGYTDEVVAAVARDIGADLALIGSLGQTGKKKTRRGNTAERVIAALDVDVMVFN